MTELWYQLVEAFQSLRSRRKAIELAWVVVVTTHAIRDQTRKVANTTGQSQIFWEVRGMFRDSAAADQGAAQLVETGRHVDRTSIAHYRIAEIRPVHHGVIQWAPSDYIHPHPGVVSP